MNILCKANKLPSDSTAYRVGNDLKQLECPVTMNTAECVEKNLDVPYFLDSHTTSLKMDETFLPHRSIEIQYTAQRHARSVLPTCPPKS